MPTRKDKAEKPREPAKGADAPDEVAEAGSALSLDKLPKGGPTKADLKRYRAMLVEIRRGALKNSQNLADEALKASGQDFSVDHMADHGTDNFEQDFSLSLLEGESELVRDIHDAITKIDGRAELPFGLCEACADEIEDSGQASLGVPWIAKGRLDAIPYARLCVAHQERQEESAGE